MPGVAVHCCPVLGKAGSVGEGGSPFLRAAGWAPKGPQLGGGLAGSGSILCASVPPNILLRADSHTVK